jgi:iron complex transport system ATP-binding protein
VQSNSVVSLKDINLIRNDKTILSHINLEIFNGENWVFLGSNGSGKTSLINIIYGYIWPSKGKTTVFGIVYGEDPIREAQSRIGIVESSHQNHLTQKNLTVREIISTGIIPSIGLYKELNKKELEVVDKIIDKHKWIKDRKQKFHSLSVGEKQKILLLRSLASNPELLILDEPCSSLDLGSREDFLYFLDKEISKKKISCILITHRTEEISTVFTNCLLLKSGKIVSAGKIDSIITNENLTKAYNIRVQVYNENNRYFTKVIKRNGTKK